MGGFPKIGGPNLAHKIVDPYYMDSNIRYP